MNSASQEIGVSQHGLPAVEDLRQTVLAGLAARPRSLPPKLFYDERGSELFDGICEQPEYYPTTAEMGILERIREELAARIGTGATLIEFGSGASRKIRLLLDALRPERYLGLDISRDFLLACTRQLGRDYPWLAVQAACIDYTRDFELPELPTHGRPLAFFAGSSIGNFEPADAETFLHRVHRALGRQGALLIGVDLKKDQAVLEAAYNDAAGFTAAFNRNLLTRMQLELGAELNVDAFRHKAFYNTAAGRIEMHLESTAEQIIRIDGQAFAFQAGETIHTENSYKYGIEEFQAMARRAGFRPAAVWTDPRELFSLHYVEAD